jgi:hypothetical protein
MNAAVVRLAKQLYLDSLIVKIKQGLAGKITGHVFRNTYVHMQTNQRQSFMPGRVSTFDENKETLAIFKNLITKSIFF